MPSKHGNPRTKKESLIAEKTLHACMHACMPGSFIHARSRQYPFFISTPTNKSNHRSLKNIHRHSRCCMTAVTRRSPPSPGITTASPRACTSTTYQTVIRIIAPAAAVGGLIGHGITYRPPCLIPSKSPIALQPLALSRCGRRRTERLVASMLSSGQGSRIDIVHNVSLQRCSKSSRLL